MLARSKFNSIESKISKRKALEESIRMMNSQRSDVEKISLIEEGIKIVVSEVIKLNEITNNSLKP